MNPIGERGRASGDLLAKVGQLGNEERPPRKERVAPGVPLLAALDPLAVTPPLPRRPYCPAGCPGYTGPAVTRSRMMKRWILPIELRGRSSQTRTSRGHL